MTLCTTEWWCGPLYILMLGVSPILLIAILALPFIVKEGIEWVVEKFREYA